MTTAQDHKSNSEAKVAIDFWPTTGSETSIFLYHAAEYLKGYTAWPDRAKPDGLRPKQAELDYHDHKSSQLLEALSDLILAETRISSWFVDLGFDGQCQIEDSSIGGVPCIMADEDAEV